MQIMADHALDKTKTFMGIVYIAGHVSNVINLKHLK